MTKAWTLSLLSILFIGFTTYALATSTIDPTQPPQGAPYQSAPIRNNFGAAANDVNALQTCNFGSLAPPVPQSGYCWVNTSAAPTWTYNFYDAVTAKWVPVFNFDSVNSLLEPPIGGGLPGTVASAATTDLCSVPQSTLTVTGTTTVTSFGTTCAAGQIKFVSLAGILTLQNNATSLILPGGTNITTASGDTAIAAALGGGNWKVLFYQVANQPPLAGLAPLNSPAFTGTPTAPTGVAASGSTQIATLGALFAAIPIKLTAPLTLNVATTGSDGNNCVAAPCLTIQHACDTVNNSYDLNSFQIIIQVAAGSYTGGCSNQGLTRGLSSFGNFLIKGDLVTPDNVSLVCPTSCFSAGAGAQFTVEGFKLVSSTYDIQTTYGGGVIEYAAIDFGSATSGQLFANVGGQLLGAGNYTISGNSPFHLVTNAGIIIAVAPFTVSCAGSPAFSSAFAVASLPGTIDYPTPTVSFSACGGVTGSRYTASLNGVIFTNGGGANFFPGNSGGTTATGGQYN